MGWEFRKSSKTVSVHQPLFYFHCHGHKGFILRAGTTFLSRYFPQYFDSFRKNSFRHFDIISAF